MKLSELIAAYGDDRVQVQWLDECLISMNMSKDTTKATFGTEQPLNLDGFVQMGIVVWLDRDEARALIDRARNGGRG